MFDIWYYGRFLLAIRYLIGEKLRFLKILGYLDVFWPFLPQFFKMTEYNRIFFERH